MNTDLLVPLSRWAAPVSRPYFQGTMSAADFANLSAQGEGLHVALFGSSIPGSPLDISVPTLLGQGDYVHLELRDTDFGVARVVTEAINRKFAQPLATAVDGRTIRVRAPQTNDARVAFLAQLEDISVETAVPAAKIIINARTGSVVMNQAVSIEASTPTEAPRFSVSSFSWSKLLLV